MKLIGLSSAFAPAPTGHPLGLPGQMSAKASDTRVAEPAKSSASNLATNLGMQMRKQASAQADKPDKTAPKTKPDASEEKPAQSKPDQKPSAPPTILQLKINEILQAQADEMPDVEKRNPTDDRGQHDPVGPSVPNRSDLQEETRPAESEPTVDKPESLEGNVPYEASAGAADGQRGVNGQGRTERLTSTPASETNDVPPSHRDLGTKPSDV